MPSLSQAYAELALQLQESTSALTADDVASAISTAIRDQFRGTDLYGYLITYAGDAAAGDAFYRCNGETMKASYAIAQVEGSAAKCTIDFAAATAVVPRVIFEPKTTEVPATEGDRDKPVKLNLIEGDSTFPIDLQESGGTRRSSYPIKMISPGAGSSAFYSAKMLEASADKFKRGTLMFWNHPTRTEEANRPEGDLNHLAAITTTDARWDANGAKGPGLYAEAKVMADYAERVEERAPHIGLSIRAGGTGTGRMVEGKPELASIDYVESVDYVTKAGRGGLALAEAARDAGLLDLTESEATMPLTDQELAQLRESLLAPTTSQVTRLLEAELRRDALAHGAKVLKGIELPGVSKERVIEAVVSRSLPKDAAGNLDLAKLTEAYNEAAKEEGAYVAQLTGGRGVRGFGAAPAAAPAVDAKEAAALADYDKRVDQRAVKVFESILGGNAAAAQHAFQGRPGDLDDEFADLEGFGGAE